MEKKYNIHTDRLIIAYHNDEATSNYILSNISDEGGNFDEFTLFPSSTFPSYRYNYDIVADGNVVGHLYWGHYNPTLQSIYIKYNNKALYFNNKHYISYIEDRLYLKFEKLQNIDLAIDVNFNIVSRIYKILKDKDINKKILNKVYTINDNVPIITTCSGTLKNLLANKTLSIVSKSQGLSLHGYNKSREITENNNSKQYINEVNGFKRTWRLEVRCSHKELRNTLEALCMTEDEVYMLALSNNRERLGVLYRHLIDRILMVRTGRKSINILDYIADNG